MTEPESQPARDREQRLAESLQQFVDLHDAGQTPDVDQFCAGQPEELRAEVRARCLDVLHVKRLLARQRETHTPVELGDLTGRQLGDYRIERELGRGGMGVVYLATQVSLDRSVALKVLAPHLAQSKLQLERFRREAIATGHLQHPGIVRILSVGEEQGLHYYAMEYVDGESLNHKLDRMRAGPRSVRDLTRGTVTRPDSWNATVATITAAVAEALDVAHKNGVIHRDIKPHNVLVDAEGRPHVVDFGLAKVLAEESLSRTGDLAGTPHYMSPEQTLARRIEIDHRTDIYSLGVILYEMLTLHRPFEGDTVQQLLYDISYKVPKPLRRYNVAVPKDLETICLKAMEKSPSHRYASAADLARDLRHFLDHEAIDARPPSPFERLVRFTGRHRREAAGFAAAAILVTGISLALAGVTARQATTRAISDLRKREPAALATARADMLGQLLHDVVEMRSRRLHTADDRQLGELETRLRSEGERRKLEGRTLLEQGLAPHDTDAGRPLRVQSDAAYFRALRTLFEASLLLEDQEGEELRKLEGTFPTLTIEVHDAAAGAHAFLRPIEPVTGTIGESMVLPPLPLRKAPIPPGMYRIVVTDSSSAFSEVTRNLDQRGHDYVVDAYLKTPAQVEQGMQRIPAGAFTYGMHGDSSPLEQERRVELPEYLIDEREVSNGDYRRFLEATGHDRPGAWPENWDARWNDLPVTWVSAFDAMRYAEWCGKRLPTLAEWEKAARGPGDAIFPWGNDSSVMRERANVESVVMDLSEGGRGRWESYLEHAQPVSRFHPDSRSPYGLVHVLGNVAEWTETTPSTMEDGAPVALLPLRFLAGGSWYGNIKILTALGVTLRMDSPASTHSMAGGFRCAKSMRP